MIESLEDAGPDAAGLSVAQVVPAMPLATRRRLLAVGAGCLAAAFVPNAAAAFVQTRAPRADQVVVSKSKRTLLLMSGRTTLARYRVDLGFAPDGHKLRSGDGRTPEGRYTIDRRNPRSDFYLSIGVSYPNALDIARARALGLDSGGDIFIHGGPRTRAQRKRDWTAGCIAVTDAEIEEIWSLVPTGVPISILV